MQRQWSDYRKVKDGLPAMKTGAWLLTRLFGTKAGLVAVLLGLAFWFGLTRSP
jgi:hypothetical protein